MPSSVVDAVCDADGCNRPCHFDERICRTCQDLLARALRLLVTPVGEPERTLLEELDATIQGQAQMRSPIDGSTSRGAERPLPWNEHAAQVKAELFEVLLGWQTLIAGQLDHLPSVFIASSHAAATWCLRYGNTIATMESAGDCVTQILAAVRKAERAVDRPPTGLFCGPCEATLDTGLVCPDVLWATEGYERVTCRSCRTQWFVEEKRAWLGELADTTVPLTATVMAALMQSVGVKVSAAQIRGLAARGRVQAVTEDGRGRPQYLIADVRLALADRYVRRRDAAA